MLHAHRVLGGSLARQATLFADAVTALLREHTAIARLRELEAQLRTALTSRPIIDQAKGILMARNGFDADAAFAELVTRSQHANIKLRELARQLVTEASDRTSRAPAGQSAPPAPLAEDSPLDGHRERASHPASDGATPVRPPSGAKSSPPGPRAGGR